VKLTLKIKLLPDPEQAKILLATLKEANSACNVISEIGWRTRRFSQIKLHHESYYSIRSAFNLSSQMIIRCISKVADAYKKDKKTKRVFRPLGSVAYDNRILTYKSDKIVSIWSLEGRILVPFKCHNKNYFPYVEGEADLVYKKGKFFLFQTCEVPEDDVKDVEEFIGVDFGLTDIAYTSDGKKHTAEWLNAYREKRVKVRSSIQRKGTKSSKRLLKRLSGREKTTATIQNHTISKSIVADALVAGKGISVENLTFIRDSVRAKTNKKLRAKVSRWNFRQLRAFLQYKANAAGVPFVAIEPAYTSKTCSKCYHIGIRSNKVFRCENCGSDMDADLNASRNIATLGAVYISQPESSIMCCSLQHRN
jgi:putative transposase